MEHYEWNEVLLIAQDMCIDASQRGVNGKVIFPPHNNLQAKAVDIINPVLVDLPQSLRSTSDRHECITEHITLSFNALVESKR